MSAAEESAASFRLRCRRRELNGPSAGQAPGFAQANLVMVPREHAWDFLVFCQRNPRPCPLIEVTDAGSWNPIGAASGADLRTDLPRYRIYREGALVDEPTDVVSHWRADLVSFLLGCSFTFENALLREGLSVRHLEEFDDSGRSKNVPMYRTTIACRPAGVFSGPLVVSMRPMPAEQAIRAIAITSRYPWAHGAPVHLGNPSAIGVEDLDQPDWGDRVSLRPGEVPVFWACGVTSQAALLEARLSFAITHAPGCMFVTDLPDQRAPTDIDVDVKECRN